ncbi:MAG: glutathione S-transferase family protein [Myxococcales bacterium]|jgi:glutathione S-transferase|nr:glutathione S-transferase family protein [Myxococcales bacterium]
MAITLHYGSGSPFAWRVWLALEHKQLPYELRVVSFDRGDTRSPEYIALNPRGKVPTLVDGAYVLYESNAIVEYLEDAYPERPLLPHDPQARGVQRRLIAEADNYLFPAQRELMRATLFCPPAERDPARIAAAGDAVIAELERFAPYLEREWFGGNAPSLADFTIYPYIRLVQRVEDRVPEVALRRRFPPAIAAYVQRFETLPYADKTQPPHWRG